MGISANLQFAAIDDLYCDPMNPRLGRHHMDRETTQDRLLEYMKDWAIEELALSYLENGGFWTHEALLVVKEKLYGEERLVVVEGNRRLAALAYLRDAYAGKPASRKWKEMAESAEEPPGLFRRIPYLLADSRSDVQSFLGFRHVTGIKQWEADEKAGFIAKLIDEQGMTYEQVRRKIGSKMSTVRHHYIAYRLLLQMEDAVESFKPEMAENRFAILYMCLNTKGTRNFLGIDDNAEPARARRPVPDEHLPHLADFAGWLFGVGDETPALIHDTRHVSDFGRILESTKAVEYLQTKRNPKFEVAFRVAGGDEEEIIRYVNEASENVELALTRAHFFRDSQRLQDAVRRFGSDATQLLSVFPHIRRKIEKSQE